MSYLYFNDTLNNKQYIPKCIDLFCGAGGFTLGFCQAGGIPIAAVDHDLDSINTYKMMFPFCRETYCGSIETWQTNKILQDVDVVIGGPPCQGFSQARGLRFVDDPRNYLYKEFVRLVAEVQPSWVVMENVEGIISLGKGFFLQQIYDDFREIGYQIDHRVITMADYGVPQTRKRAIFVGTRTNQNFMWPEPTHKPWTKLQLDLFNEYQPYVSVEQALGDLPWPMGKYFAHRANSQMRGPRNRLVAKDPAFTLRIRGDEFALCEEPAVGAFVPGHLPERELIYMPISNAFQQLMREEPPPWIEAYQAPVIYDIDPPKLQGTRRLAIRELARLQTFPDWFAFTGRPYSQARQIGNAVPPLFARQLFQAIFRHLNKSEIRQDHISTSAETLFKNMGVSAD